MRVTLLNQFYPPDLAPTGHLAASLAVHLASRGDEVIVVTSQGGYVPESRTRHSNPSTNPRVIRLWTPRAGKASFVRRLVDYLLFYMLTTLRLVSLASQDVIVSLTTPPFIGLTAVLYKRLHRNTKFVLWSMDCYPEVLERAGLLVTTSRTSRFMRSLNRKLFHELDHLVCLDPAMEHLLSVQYIPSTSKLASSVIENWERLTDFPPSLQPPKWPQAERLGISDKFVVLYLGNAGYGHEFDTIFETAARLMAEDFVFVFVGGGARWGRIRESGESLGLSNLLLLGYVQRDMTASVMAAAHCALVTLSDPFLGVISPSKIHANLAMGLPLAYVGPEGGNVDLAIRRFDCGVSLRHGDVDGLLAYLRRLKNKPVEHQAYRRRARRAFEEAYSDAVALPKFDRILDRLVARPSG